MELEGGRDQWPRLPWKRAEQQGRTQWKGLTCQGGIRDHIPDEGRFTFRPTAHKVGDGVGKSQKATNTEPLRHERPSQVPGGGQGGWRVGGGGRAKCELRLKGRWGPDHAKPSLQPVVSTWGLTVGAAAVPLWSWK